MKPSSDKPSVAFEPIERPRAFEVICDQIRERLAAGSLTPGMKLPAERELARQFGVSRTAVREAMRTLESAGIIRLQKGARGGAFICDRDAGAMTKVIQELLDSGVFSLADLTEARVLVQDMVVRLACLRATDADFRALERNVDQTEEFTRLGRINDRIAASAEFYRLLATATRNPVLAQLTASLSTILLEFLRFTTDAAPLPGLIAARRRFLGHLVARDAEKASAELTAHLRKLNAHLLRGHARMKGTALSA
jgi:GntR family transcriptional regulator, transcriptional repressor for pyruvate dehydrogenase complex